MSRPLASRLRATPRPARGQTIALGAITLLILALITFITLNVTLSIHQKIKLQNYADAKAFSLAVQEARALNYFAYTNRAIASAYVSMANMHAYMSEATMVADAHLAASEAMFIIAAEEEAQCFCGWVPCRPQHCAHGIEAGIYAALYAVDYATGDLGDRVQELDGPFRTTVNALNAHARALHLSQVAVRTSLSAHLATGGEMAALKRMNVGEAPVSDGTAASVAAAAEFNDVFYSEEDEKKRIMAEIANATRPDFTWNRATNPQSSAALFLPLMRDLRSGAGNRGEFVVVQLPSGVGIGSAGRTGFTDGSFPGSGFTHAATRDPPAGEVDGSSLNSFDFGELTVRWRHGVGAGLLPAMERAGPGVVISGENHKHENNNGWIPLNDPHTGSDHDVDLDLSRFMEFKISEDAPFNQPAVYATASGETRVNERGQRAVFEVTESGRVTFEVGQAGTGTVQLSNAGTAHVASKALVYYHRIGDWSDYPNMFNPYWRAKLEPMTLAEAALVLGSQDSDSAAVVTTMSAMPGGRGAVNLQ